MLFLNAMSGCIAGPFIDAYDPPIACAIEVYKAEPAGPPAASVIRGDQIVDVTGPVEDLGAVDLDRAIYTVDCDGNVVSETHTSEPYRRFRFTLTGAQVGELLTIEGMPGGTVMADGACPIAVVPQPSCSGMYDWSVCEGDASPPNDSGHDLGDDLPGCNAGGSTGLGAALALLALGRKRKHRPEAGASSSSR